MTTFKLINGWEDEAKKYDTYYGREYKGGHKRMRRLSKKDEKVLLGCILNCSLSEVDSVNNCVTYFYRG